MSSSPHVALQMAEIGWETRHCGFCGVARSIRSSCSLSVQGSSGFITIELRMLNIAVFAPMPTKDDDRDVA